ncbi:MAG: DUF58 domain-containing protein [Planctomycetaceae bacterium]
MQSNQSGFEHRYLRLADLRRLEQMLFAPRKIVEGRFSGHFQTRQRGQSIEFRDYREYLPGDEISAIDWKAYGRTDKLYIRLFEHQSELTVQLLVDGSASMAYGSAVSLPRQRPDSKYDYACRLAAAIGFLVIKQHDRFAFGIAQQGLKSFTPAEGTQSHLAGILETMQSHRPKWQSGLAAALGELSRSGRKRSLLVLMSDLLDDGEAVAAALAARVHSGGEAVVFHVLHPDEMKLPDLDHATFIDSETRERVRLSVAELRSVYAEKMDVFLRGWESRCRSLGIDYIRAVTSLPYHQMLERYLIGRAARGGRRR